MRQCSRSYRGRDVHLGTAIAASLAPPGATKDTHARPRNIGKAINFCLMYGGGVPGLAAKLRCPSHEAATFLASVLKAFPVFTQWSDYQVGRGAVPRLDGITARLATGCNEGHQPADAAELADADRRQRNAPGGNRAAHGHPFGAHLRHDA